MVGEWSWSDLATKARTRLMAATNGRDGTGRKERWKIMHKMEFHEVDGSFLEEAVIMSLQ